MSSQFPDLDVSVEEISPIELKRRLDDGEQLTLLDTRRPSDFEAWHITHPNLAVHNRPFTEFLNEDDQPVDSIPTDLPDGLLICCCAKGLSSHYVASVLAREGRDVLALKEGMEGWAYLYEERVLDVDGEDVEVVQFHRPSSGCLAYLFVAGDEAAVVDPLRTFATDYVEAANRRDASITYALDTHVHADHVSGVRDVAALTDATVVLPEGTPERGLDYDATLVEATEELALGNSAIEAVALPGHTSEMMGYRFGGVLATGDTVFLDGVARPDLEDEEEAREAAGTLWETLQRLDVLPDDVVIAPGHAGPETTPRGDGTFVVRLGQLREGLAAFDESKDAFVDRVMTDLPPRPNNFERIIDINLGRDSADPAEAFELELGPNNCAVAE